MIWKTQIFKQNKINLFLDDIYSDLTISNKYGSEYRKNRRSVISIGEKNCGQIRIQVNRKRGYSTVKRIYKEGSKCYKIYRKFAWGGVNYQHVTQHQKCYAIVITSFRWMIAQPTREFGEYKWGKNDNFFWGVRLNSIFSENPNV